jgi:hypothetical protein
MDRRTVVAVAGACALTVVAGTAALAANLGMLDDASTDPVGDLSPVDVTTQTSAPSVTAAPPSTGDEIVETIVIDEYVNSPSGATPPPSPPALPSGPLSTVSDVDDGTTELSSSTTFELDEPDEPDEPDDPDEPDEPDEPEYEYEGAADDD